MTKQNAKPGRLARDMAADKGGRWTAKVMSAVVVLVATAVGARVAWEGQSQQHSTASSPSHQQRSDVLPRRRPGQDPVMMIKLAVTRADDIVGTRRGATRTYRVGVAGQPFV
jgi:hypothetical protein